MVLYATTPSRPARLGHHDHEAALEPFELTEHEPSWRVHQGDFFGACWSYARMISSVRSASGEA